MEIRFARGFISEEEAKEIKKAARKCNVAIYVHAPYYINLAGEDDEVTLSKDKILYAGRVAGMIGAKILVIHPGFYGKRSEKETKGLIVRNLKDIVSRFKKEKIGTKLGVETMGKQKVFGSLDDVIGVCKEVKGSVPVVDLGHIHARCNGCLKKREDFENIFDKLKPLRLKYYLVHVTGVLYENGNEIYHVPIKKGDMPIDPLIDLLLDRKYNVSLISESPLLEHDAMYIRLQIEKAIMKRTGKETADYRDLSGL